MIDKCDIDECYIFKIRKWGVCIPLMNSQRRCYTLCTKSYILDGATERNNRQTNFKNVPIGDVEDFDFHKLKIKLPEEFTHPDDFDIIAYKKNATRYETFKQLLCGETINWDWEENKTQKLKVGTNYHLGR